MTLSNLAQELLDAHRARKEAELYQKAAKAAEDAAYVARQCEFIRRRLREGGNAAVSNIVHKIKGEPFDPVERAIVDTICSELGVDWTFVSKWEYYGCGNSELGTPGGWAPIFDYEKIVSTLDYNSKANKA